MQFPSDLPEKRKPRRASGITLTRTSLILLLAINLLILGALAWSAFRSRVDIGGLVTTQEIDQTDSPLAETLLPTASPDATQNAPQNTPLPADEVGLLLLAIREGLDTHLFAYRPVERSSDTLPLTRLTSGTWDDITPALSPDGRWIAFSSNRSGEWQIYLWNLEDGQIAPLTNQPGYKASPTWSPDGLWLAYEGYSEESLDIFIQAADGSTSPMAVTNHQAADFSPAWSPQGRMIAFVSTRGGREQIWLADLDQSGEARFTSIENLGEARALHPLWSPDGRYLSWGAVLNDGFHKIFSWDREMPQHPPLERVSGDAPAWSRTGNIIYAVLDTPHQNYLTAYDLAQPGLVWLPPVALPGKIESITWVDLAIEALLPAQPGAAPTALWNPAVEPNPEIPGGRWSVVDLQDIAAPYPQLHDRVDEAFNGLRAKVAEQTGWDALAVLENAYVPLTIPLPPGYQQDWLYTGRAFALSPLPVHAGWLAVLREDFGQETYWRVFLRARHQDGTQGQPLHALPWDFDARYRDEPLPYEHGGALLSNIPGGYWIDLTELAAAYGWQRLPAFSNWRAAYSASHFNEFVRTDGLDWQSAMLELYPREVLITPTSIPTHTLTPTPTNTFTPSVTPSITLTPTITLSPSVTPSLTLPPATTPTP